jgi:hypothetical protein
MWQTFGRLLNYAFSHAAYHSHAVWIESPKPPLVIPRLPLRCPELPHPSRIKRIFDVGVPVALPDDLLVHQQAVALSEGSTDAQRG